MREDSLQKKVWIKEISGDTSEYLLYDFSLNIGDTMNSINSFFNTGKAIIDSITPYLLNNSETTRAFYVTPINFSNLEFNFFIIEGVGSPVSFINPFEEVFEHQAKLNCVKENEINLYSHSGSNSCTGIILKLDNNISKFKSFTIFPNPNKGRNIIVLGKEIKTINIFNLHGQLIKEIETKDEETVINLANHPKGIYLVKALFKNGNVVNDKLIIQ
jgi:hypothetical protein